MQKLSYTTAANVDQKAKWLITLVVLVNMVAEDKTYGVSNFSGYGSNFVQDKNMRQDKLYNQSKSFLQNESKH